MQDEFDYKFDVLKQEIEVLQETIRGYDNLLFTIKGWAITLFSAGVFFVVQSDKPIFLLFCLAIVALFWVSDAIYKSTQRLFMLRYGTIQEYLQSQRFTKDIHARQLTGILVPDIFDSRRPRDENRWIRLFRIMFTINVGTIYVFMIALIEFLAVLMILW